MSEDGAGLGGVNRRFVILNHMISRSTSRAPTALTPPSHGGYDLLSIIKQRFAKSWTIEFVDGNDDTDDKKRIENNEGKSFIRLRDIQFTADDFFRYVTLLVEFVDHSAEAFPVVHVKTFEGREIAGDAGERGSTAAHVVIRLPLAKSFDDLKYRCAIEAVPNVSRSWITQLLSRQIRRTSDGEVWTFPGVAGKRRLSAPKDYRYGARLELIADVGRSISGAVEGGAELSTMVFTKRSERQDVAVAADIKHRDVVGDVLIRVSAKQGPEDGVERLQWASQIRMAYEERGYETRLFFKGPAGEVSTGEVHPAVAGATDLLMCPRTLVDYATLPKPWVPKIDGSVDALLKEVIAKDELWQRRQS